jgi:hypothetical protein
LPSTNSRFDKDGNLVLEASLNAKAKLRAKHVYAERAAAAKKAASAAAASSASASGAAAAAAGSGGGGGCGGGSGGALVYADHECVFVSDDGSVMDAAAAAAAAAAAGSGSEKMLMDFCGPKRPNTWSAKRFTVQWRSADSGSMCLAPPPDSLLRVVAVAEGTRAHRYDCLP